MQYLLVQVTNFTIALAGAHVQINIQWFNKTIKQLRFNGFCTSFISTDLYDMAC